MSARYLKNEIGQRTATPQSQPIPGREKEMVQNNAGGYTFKLDDLAQVKRFLILGSSGGTYYARENKLTRDNCNVLEQAIKSSGRAVVDEIVRVSEGGLAPKNDPAIFALALCASAEESETRSYALANLDKVCRIPTHLYMFSEFVNGLRGWGRGLKNSVASWYLDKNAKQLAYHAVKYVQRDGWSHKDLLRIVHPHTTDETTNLVLQYMVNGWNDEPLARNDKKEKIVRGPALKDVITSEPTDAALALLWATEELKHSGEKRVVELIGKYNLPMECVPTDKRSKAVYEALLPHANITWLIRNLGNLTKTGAIATGQYSNLSLVTEKLTNLEVLKKGRVHPLAVLVAQNTYASGRGVKGDSTWDVIPDVVEALENAFYMSFDAIVPANKRFVFGLDVSGSMSYGAIAGMPGITPAIATGVLSMVTYRTEPKCVVMGFSDTFKNLGITRKDTLKTVQNKVVLNNFGGTDTSIPPTWALENKVEADVFVILTDNDTWAGKTHTSQALKKYRDGMGIPAKMVVAGMTSTGFTIADPSDPLTMDVVGFSSDTPSVISGFARGDF